jgi:hypothetical protein
VLNEKEPSNSEFLIYHPRKSRIDQRIPFFTIQCIIQYSDLSWQFNTEKAAFHFKAPNLDDNALWYDKINKTFYHKSNPYYNGSKSGATKPPDIVMSSNNRDPQLALHENETSGAYAASRAAGSLNFFFIFATFLVYYSNESKVNENAIKRLLRLQRRIIFGFYCNL